MAKREEIPAEEYAAMRKLIDPMIAAADAMSVEEIVAAMRAFYKATESNCPWYAYGLKHSLPGILAIIGDGKGGYEEAWGLGAKAIEAGTDEAPKAVQPEGRERGPSGFAQTPPGEPS